MYSYMMVIIVHFFSLHDAIAISPCIRSSLSHTIVLNQGAFIVIDMMLERIKYEKTVDIYGCVKGLRTQRNFMVQTEDQYMFIHAALLEAIDAGNTEVPARNLLAHIKKLRLSDSTGGSGMDLEFKVSQTRIPIGLIHAISHCALSPHMQVTRCRCDSQVQRDCSSVTNAKL